MVTGSIPHSTSVDVILNIWWLSVKSDLGSGDRDYVYKKY